MSHRVMAFADGENLVARYQAMKDGGRKPQLETEFEQDILVWHPKITQQFIAEIVRLSFYQMVHGDEAKLNTARKRISEVRYRCSRESEHEDITYSGSLYPKIFKKESRSAKSKSVDINLTVDVMRNAENPRIDVIFLLSGDGDYLPLLEEVSRRGKQVWLAAFSSGLNSHLRYAADEFFDLDEVFFHP